MRKKEKYLKNRGGEDVVKIQFNVGKCEVCNVNVATTRDNRDCYANGYGVGVDTFAVCYNCANLSDYDFFRLLRAQTDRTKRKILGEITETGNWKDYIRNDEE